MSVHAFHSTLAFIFTRNFQQVLLIEKLKPDFHKGFLNGLGGKLELGETALECVVREVEEESGLLIPEAEWRKAGVLRWEEWEAEVFATVLTTDEVEISNSGDEIVSWYPVNDLPENVITNLRWLIPMSINRIQHTQPFEAVVTYY